MVLRWGLDPRCSATSFMTCQARRESKSGYHFNNGAHSTYAQCPCRNRPGTEMCMTVSCDAAQSPFPQRRFRWLGRSRRYLGQVQAQCSSRDAMQHTRKGSRKPNVPMEKLSTGGTSPVLNNDEAWRIVPSPPSVTIRSILSASGPALHRQKGHHSCLKCDMTYLVSTALLHLVCHSYPRDIFSPQDGLLLSI